jgi:beta-lactamase regulating signal transducer with metallopeptidase domain
MSTTTLGWLIAAGALRGLAVGLVGALVYLAARKREPARGASAALAGLSGMAVVMAVGLCPWPRWWDPAAMVAAIDRPTEEAASVAPAVEPAGAATLPPPPTSEVDFWALMREELGRATQGSTEAASATSRGWAFWLTAGLLAVAGLALARLGIGLLAVGRLRAGGIRVDDPEILEAMDLLRAELGCSKPIALLESPDLATPATVGWRRPVVLLPADWRGWSEGERLAVLGHELAHVRRGDYAAGIWARVCLAICWFNPLAHWLFGRLRLQQELAADAWAARLSGGQTSYLATLARMALRCDRRPVAEPAWAFLPGRDTFVRRIQMLRDVPDLKAGPSRGPSRLAPFSLIAGAVVLFGGVRGPSAPAQEATKATKSAAPAPAATTDLMALVPPNAMMIIDIRPAELLASPEAEKFAADLGLTKMLVEEWGIAPEKLSRVILVWLPEGTRQGPTLLNSPSLVIAAGPADHDWARVELRRLFEPIDVPLAGKTYRRSGAVPHGPVIFYPEPGVIALGLEESSIQELVFTAAQPAPGHAFDVALRNVPDGPLRVATTSLLVRQVIFPLVTGATPAQQDQWRAMTGPLSNSAIAHAASFDIKKELTADLAVVAGDENGAKEIAQTLDALVVLGRNYLRNSPAGTADKSLTGMLDVPTAILSGAKSEVEGNVVRVRSATDLTMADLTQKFATVVVASRKAAQRSQSMNNMKQIGLAMHNFQDTFGRFPPPSLLGPDGKTPHSWRVALLPYLEQSSLYNEYKLDEPWDSPANKKVLEKMPALFRDPSDTSPAHCSSYFVPTGESTLFSGHVGTPISQITDGTSNTIMVVQASREIPWTKPDDVLISADAPLPKLGLPGSDGFEAGFADGSVRRIKASIVEATLRALFTRSGGEVIDFDQVP